MTVEFEIKQNIAAVTVNQKLTCTFALWLTVMFCYALNFVLKNELHLLANKVTV